MKYTRPTTGLKKQHTHTHKKKKKKKNDVEHTSSGYVTVPNTEQSWSENNHHRTKAFIIIAVVDTEVSVSRLRKK